ncbi:MAG: hypothetical protein CM15mP77_3170 [Synechococcus sp.]|nr:MAG: hypothetical protein CM15mP77_3170 [Synechococcus sp.]
MRPSKGRLTRAQRSPEGRTGASKLGRRHRGIENDDLSALGGGIGR